MHRKPSKKQLLIQRTIIFITMVISVVVIVTGTILFILGYRLDGMNGRIEQGALVQFDSQPSGAQVTIDGKRINSQTSTKRTVVAGEHSFLVQKDKYQPWTKQLTLDAGTLTWLDYIRLVPVDLQKQTVRSYEQVYGEKAAPDLQTIAIQEFAATPKFEIIDIRSKEVKSVEVSLPEDVYSEATTADVTHVFTMHRWSEDGRFMLLKHDFKDQSEWIVMDTENVAASVNITRALSIALSDVQFAGANGSSFYGLSDGVVRKLDLSNATISRGLVTNVTSFSLYETNTLTYVGHDIKDTTKNVVGFYRDGAAEPYVIRTTNADVALSIATTKYFNDDYIAVTEGLRTTVLKGHYPSVNQKLDDAMQSIKEFTSPSPVTELSFGPNGDYLVAQSGLLFMSYELEHDRLNTATLQTSETDAHELHWLDDAYLWAVYDGHASMREFDGTNVHVIMPVEPGFDVTLSQNGRYFYGVNKTDGTYRLERVTMILE